MMIAKHIFFLCLTLLPFATEACIPVIPKSDYVNVVRMYGIKAKGLRWEEIHNVLKYEGTRPISVYGIRNGKHFRMASWDGEKSCYYRLNNEQEECRPGTGLAIYMEYYYDLPLDTELERNGVREKIGIRIKDGREAEYTLKSKIVRNNGKYRQKIFERAGNDLCGEGE